MTNIYAIASAIRYRAILTITLFMLEGAVIHGKGTFHPWSLVGGALALAATYTFASLLNDIADEKADRINLIGHTDRALVRGGATRGRLMGFAVVSAGIALGAGALLGFTGMLVIGASLILFAEYSLPPLRVSYRPLLTPVLLACGYAGVPYVIGTIAAGASLRRADLIIVGGLTFLFASRILLKDFRDRTGDAAVGKPTPLLRYGKRAICRASTACLAVAAVIVSIAFHGDVMLVVGLVPFWCMLAYLEWKVAHARTVLEEVVAVGIGAKVGNGLLLAILGFVLLAAQHAPLDSVVGFTLVVAVPYGWLVRQFSRDSGEFVFGNAQITLALRVKQPEASNRSDLEEHIA
ncbi:MAG TPA: UbiA family prenyltransferase [Candidatus Saccharimonadales bacterium]|nr:UbiA family prenyltransferase [Candidatus Saccharimonadales bacterium]